jgi:hypothetical protein
MSIEEPGMFHVFPILTSWADASGRIYRVAGAFVRKRLDAELEGAEAEALPGI